MEDTRRRRSGGLRKLITAVFAVAFVASIISTVTAFAAANLFKIENAELSELSTTAEGSISSFDETNIVSNVTFHKLNDSAKYTITLKNTDTNDHVIESITDDNESPYISYVYDQHANEQINAGENLVFEVTAKYTTAITDINQRTQANNVKFFIHFTDLEEEIPIVPNTGVNPNTGDYIHFSVISLVISAAGLTIIGIIALKKHKKASKFIAAGIIAVAAIATTATVKAVTVEINSFTINANYALKDKLIVTYTDKNGDEQELIANYGEPVNIPDQSKDGYTLTGWEDENGNPVDPTQPITEDIKIHPAYRAHTYTIKFNGNGATSGEMTDLAMTFGEAKTLPANAFTWAGHEYTGWDTEANGSGTHYGNAAEVTDLTTEDNVVVVLYAQWSVNPFHIDYDGNGATSGEMATTNCEYDQACELRDNAFEKYGYDFAGWKYNDTIYADKADVTNIIDHGTITMQAQWTPHIYTITYTGLTSEEATTLRTAGNPDTYTIESPSFTLKNPEDRKDADGDTRERFVGWVEVIEPSTSVTLPMVGNLGSKTFNATWETVALPEYDITYNYDGGNVATANPAKLNKEQSATLSEPVKTGYTFTGWTGTTISGDTPAKPYTIPAPHQKGNLEYTAHYRANTYTVNFDINTDDTHVSGTMQPLAFSYDEEKPLTANAFTRTGYTFAGWKLGDNEYTDGQTVKNLAAEDGATVTLKAQWTPNTFTIIFHHTNNEVSNQDSMTPQAVTYDVATTIKPNTYEREHYKFMGWATNATQAANADTRAKVNTAKVYDDEADITNAVTENNGELHLYAIWLERTSELKKGYDIWYENFRGALGDNDIVSFEEYTGDRDVSAIESKRNIALNVSNFPTYLWMETDEQGAKRAYWWSEAEHPKMNSDIRQMFDALPQIERIDLSGFIFPNATVMSGVFRGDTKLTTVVFPSEAPTIAAGTSMANMFNGCASLENLNMIKNWNFSGVTDMSGLLAGAKSLESLESIKDWNVSNVATMYRMFYSSGIESVEPIKNWNVNNVENMQEMFAGANKLTSIDLSGWHTSGKLKDIAAIFESGVTEPTLTINFSGWDTSNVNSAERAFANARLIELDVSGWDMSSLTNGAFMFGIYAENLETIYYDGGSLPFDSGADTHGIFRGDAKLVGGAGSTGLNQELNVYARVDDPCSGKPGYFTLKNHQYICFHANNGTDARKGQYVSTTASDQLDKNEFTHEGFRFLGWAESDDATAPLYTDEAAITLAYIGKEPKNLYAVWVESSSMLHSGLRGISDDINSLAGDDILDSFEKYNNGTPDIDNLDTVIVSTSDSYFPTYIWREDNKVYWWSEADKVYMNPESGNMFYAVRVKNVSLVGLDSSKVTNLSRMFQGGIVESVNFGSDFDTSHVTTMGQMFWRTTGITSLDLSSFSSESLLTVGEMFTGNTNLQSVTLGNSFTLSDVTSMASMFNGCSSLESIDLSKITFENVTTISNLFNGASALANITLGQNINAEKLTDASSAFKGTSSLETLDLSSFHAPSLADMPDMFRTTGIKNLDLSNLGATSITNIHEAFWGMTNLETIDISNLKLSGSQSPAGLFYNDSKLTTIYANDNTDFSSATSSTYGSATRLRGGAGTAPTNNPSYLRIDDPDDGKPGVFTLRGSRYIRYNSNGADGTESMTSHYLDNTGSLKTNTFTNTGKTFAGWNTEADGSGASYTDGQLMSDIVESKEPLTLYAQWQ